MLFVVAEMVLGDESALTTAFLIARENKQTKDVVLSRVAEFTKDFSVRIEPERRLE